MPVSIVSPPAALSVSLQQIKDHLRIDHDHEDGYLEELAGAATAHVEADIRQYLIERTVCQYVDHVPATGTVSLETWPVRSIVSVTGYDNAGEPVNVGSGSYQLITYRDQAQVVIDVETLATPLPNGFEIEYVSGYGPTGLDVPSNIVRAIMLLCGHWYEYRSAYSSAGEIKPVPPGISSLLKSARRVRL